MSNLVHNEQTKMLASAFNNLAVISMATGFLIPNISVFLDPTHFELSLNHLPALVMGFAGFVLCSIIAQFILRDLREDQK